ncbi:MAG TPA: TIM-barrel domain-containing protein, partial [Castellaniella sp.]|nr:TIM-barrel domain-containing protein [Castellaniella sp.]
MAPAKPSVRAQRHAALLLAREEAVGELEVSSPEPGCWRLAQGETALQVSGSASPLLQLLRGGEPVATARFPLPEEDGAWRLEWLLDEDEGLYGLGETQGDADRRGECLASDVSADRTLPLAWSPRGWGVYVNTLDRVVHDLRRGARYDIRATAIGLDVFLFVGDPSEILNQYTALTGRAGQPNLWPMGVWLDQAPGQSLATSLEQIRSLRSQGMAMDVLALSDPAIIGFQADKPVFEWNGRVADWRESLTRAQAVNVHLAGSCFPGVLQGTPLFEEWADRGWLLCGADGDVWLCPGNAASGGRPFGLLDLTHKDARRLWTERHLQ